MLSAGMPFCRARVQEVVALEGAARKEFLATAGRELEQSVAAMNGRARFWHEAGSAR